MATFYKSSGIRSDYTSENVVFFMPFFLAPKSHENMISLLGTEKKQLENFRVKASRRQKASPFLGIGGTEGRSQTGFGSIGFRQHEDFSFHASASFRWPCGAKG